ncbi:MAG: DUF6356 family protein [Janthinobacterium lividum]
MFGRLFLDHPRSVDESYVAHAGVAFRFGLTMIAGGCACLAHGLVPALFTRTGSNTVRRLHAGMSNRHAKPPITFVSVADWQPTYEI